MLLRKVTASAKGQFSIPADMMLALGAGKGPLELVLVQDGNRIIVTPADDVAHAIVDDLQGLSALAEPVFQRLWDNEFDEVWNDA